ncbi:rRNA methyltransferase 3, mitochondrial [Bradysia coprophila]|uniref:rRNA methyltransferase 3, mitochondrial n=1 Tax=Bradysia coprophila TaxID=38358 RepID=UPI00187D9C85|nr:rRNA methyltransferase 3, mitochondrial [Bradysia coprophila]
MFCLSSLIRKTVSNRQIVNDIRQAAILFHTAPLLLRSEVEDVLAAQSVEESLFENNQRHSSFVSKRNLLEQYDNGKQNRKHRKKQIVKEVQNDTVQQPIKTASASVQKKDLKKSSPELIIDEEIGFRYTKLQRNNETFQQLMLLVKSKKQRNVKHLLLLEGRRLILDAITCGLPLKYLIFSDLEQLKLVSKFAPKDVTCYKVSEGDMSFWSTLTTCPGLMAIVEKPVDMSNIWKQQNPLPITVICDQVREPNNIGGIIRACAALPVEKVILTKGCADQWDTKALRGGAGSQFLVPTMGPMAWDSIYSVLPRTYNVLVAENNADNAETLLGSSDMDRFVAYTDIPQCENCVIVIGGETEGVSAEAYELMKTSRDGCCVHIPLANGVDSLNTSTALAIILFEIRKRMTERMKNQCQGNDALSAERE